MHRRYGGPQALPPTARWPPRGPRDDPRQATGERPSPLGATVPSVEAFLASSRRLSPNTKKDDSTDGTVAPGDPRDDPRQTTGDRPRPLGARGRTPDRPQETVPVLNRVCSQKPPAERRERFHRWYGDPRGGRRRINRSGHRSVAEDLEGFLKRRRVPTASGRPGSREGWGFRETSNIKGWTDQNGRKG